jgi:hypothetical protein
VIFRIGDRRAVKPDLSGVGNSRGIDPPTGGLFQRSLSNPFHGTTVDLKFFNSAPEIFSSISISFPFPFRLHLKGLEIIALAWKST